MTNICKFSQINKDGQEEMIEFKLSSDPLNWIVGKYKNGSLVKQSFPTTLQGVGDIVSKALVRAGIEECNDLKDVIKLHEKLIETINDAVKNEKKDVEIVFNPEKKPLGQMSEKEKEEIQENTLTLDEAEEETGAPRHFIYALTNKGLLTAERFGKSFRVSRDKLDFIREQNKIPRKRGRKPKAKP